MFINKNTNASYNFKAPNAAGDADKKIEVLFPSVEAQTPDYAATIALTIAHLNTQVAVVLTGDATINLTIDSEVTKNAEMLLQLSASGAERVVTLGTGFSGSAIAIPSATTVSALLKYDGTNFVLVTSTNDNVQDGAITAAKLASNAVETAKIKDSNVTAAKLAADAVETAKIKDGNVTVAKIAKGAEDNKTYTLKSTNGVVGWVEDSAG